MRRLWVWIPVGVAVIGGCGSTWTLEEEPDWDGDGWVEGDCNKDDARIFPNALEICDGRDNDCDDLIDEDIAGVPAWYPDDDGDGFGSDDPELAVEACAAPSGHVEDSSDCRDDDPEVHPDAVEVEDDDLDNDCDGTIL